MGAAGRNRTISPSIDPAKAADVLKAMFVDRSSAVGVDMKNGSVTYVAPARISVGNGGSPYELNAKLIWRGGNVTSTEFGAIVHTQPQTP